jgi:hypothetical protein
MKRCKQGVNFISFPPKGRGFCRSAVLRSPERKMSVSDSFPFLRLKRRGLQGRQPVVKMQNHYPFSSKMATSHQFTADRKMAQQPVLKPMRAKGDQ